MGIAATVARISGAFARAAESVADRMLVRPIASVDDLSRFVGERAALVAQTTLYGYLKTRMGTKFVRYFEDEVFAAGIKAGAVRQFVSCASDLSIHAAALVAAEGRLDGGAASALARRCFDGALAQGLEDVEPDMVPAEAGSAFAARALRTDWTSAAEGEAPFARSIEDLIGNAPVVDDFKAHDAEIVRASIRFRWREVRRELRRRLDAGTVAGDWRAGPAG
jgi:hypothetical protein